MHHMTLMLCCRCRFTARESAWLQLLSGLGDPDGEGGEEPDLPVPDMQALSQLDDTKQVGGCLLF